MEELYCKYHITSPQIFPERSDLPKDCFRGMQVESVFRQEYELISPAQTWYIEAYHSACYAEESLAALVAEGLITGPGGRLNPLACTTRAEAAVMLYRIYNL